MAHSKYLKSSAGKRNGSEDDGFPIILVSFLAFFLLIGLYFHAKKEIHEPIKTDLSRVITRFVFDKTEKSEAHIEPHEQIPAEPVSEPKQTKTETEPENTSEPKDLTSNQVHSRYDDDIAEKNDVPDGKKVRRVYGVKKVYSRGIGVSGDANDAIVGKRGNTLKTEIDTFTATNDELDGELVSITAVTRYPKLKFQVKPEYTKEMLEKKIEGVIRVKILIDTDGKVKKAIALNDLGYGSGKKVHEACLKLEFEPALAGQTPVAVWYLIRFRFEMLNN
ncbi:MAG: energy transducer TonB [Fibrobacter sp.]|nr:energy transducer TonB [Fibrobacter sp.]